MGSRAHSPRRHGAIRDAADGDPPITPGENRMHKRTNAILRAMLGASLMWGTGAALAADAGPALLPKQLAGPPAELEAMRAPYPAGAATLQRSTPLPGVLDVSTSTRDPQ